MRTTTPAKLDCYGLTDRGKQRESNEDQYLVADLAKAVRIESTSLSYDRHTDVTGHSHGKVFAVADGVGGHAGGQRASTLAVDETIKFMVDRMRWSAFIEDSCPEQARRDLAADLKKGFAACQRRIFSEAALNPSRRGMGTTLTMALVDWPSAHVVHAGDSRCYLHRGGAVRQLTRDHTLAQVALDAGMPRPLDSVQRSRLNNSVWNVLGGPDDKLSPEWKSLDLDLGDDLVLCSDGLTSHVEDHEIADVLEDHAEAEVACHRLVELANGRGGTDNITVVVARFHGADEIKEVPAATSQHQLSSEADTVDLVNSDSLNTYYRSLAEKHHVAEAP